MKTIPDLLLEVSGGFSIETLSSEEVCRDWFLKRIHPEKVLCPECCQELVSQRRLASFWALKRVQCPSCTKSFSAVTGTALNGIGIDFRALYLLLFLVGCGVSVSKVARQLGISNGAAYLWARKAKGVAAGPGNTGIPCVSHPESPSQTS